MIDRVVVNPVITSAAPVAQHSFITVDDELYLVDNAVSGDDAYKEGVVFGAGEYLNGYLVRSLDGQKLVVDEKHIKYGNGVTEYDDIEAGTTVLTADADTGKLAVASAAPDEGVYFLVSDKCRLTENAVKVVIKVVDVAGE